MFCEKVLRAKYVVNLEVWLMRRLSSDASTLNVTVCFRHDPVTCTVLKRWQKKCADDSETSNWISANTKECPECHATIEKVN